MVETGINWDIVEQYLESEEPYRDIHGEWVKSMFLGTVFELVPSGKYYTSWTSNQAVEDAELDAAWWEQLEREADERGYSIHVGEDDPCDIFVLVVVEHFEGWDD